jgi:hypothetical protein
VNRDESAGSVPVVAVAERVIGADPAQVWALVADPMRVGDWAGLETVGYMGTELPKTGQVVFVRSRRGLFKSQIRRVEVQQWEAGSRYRCEIKPENRAAVCFQLAMTPEVTGSAIATRIKLTQTTRVPRVGSSLVERYVGAQLTKRLDRIEKTLR